MCKIVFFNIPAHGHTNPTLGVVKELVSRGHEVRYYSYNIFRDKIESSGANFVSCDDYDAETELDSDSAMRIGNDIAYSTKLLVDKTLALDDKVCKDMSEFKPDCIVADSMALWGKAVAMKLGIPFVSSTTTFAFNKHSAKIMNGNIVDLFSMMFSLPKIAKQIKRLQGKGYPVKNILDIIGTDESVDTIVYTSPQFQPCSETFSDKFSFVGPSVRTSYEEIEKTRDKLIYISMGTVNNDLLSFYENCISAFSDTEYQVIMAVGNSVSFDDIGILPDNITVYPYVDQIAVLEKADIFISHCGMNSVSESLYFEVPLIMMPQTSEQMGVANRVFELGAGLKLKKNDASLILSSVHNILNDSSYKQNAAIISAGFKNCQGAKGAADKILKVLSEK